MIAVTCTYYTHLILHLLEICEDRSRPLRRRW